MREEVREGQGEGGLWHRAWPCRGPETPAESPGCVSPAAPQGGPGFPWPRSSFPANSMGSRSSRIASGRRALMTK